MRLVPNVKMILVGEPHPEFPIEAMIRSHGAFGQRARAGLRADRGFRRLPGACDIVLNLRYPTVGESSGTLLRSLGLGKAVMVSEVGCFQRVPGRCLPEGAGRCRARKT